MDTHNIDFLRDLFYLSLLVHLVFAVQVIHIYIYE